MVEVAEAGLVESKATEAEVVLVAVVAEVVEALVVLVVEGVMVVMVVKAPAARVAPRRTRGWPCTTTTRSRPTGAGTRSDWWRWRR